MSLSVDYQEEEDLASTVITDTDADADVEEQADEEEDGDCADTTESEGELESPLSAMKAQAELHRSASNSSTGSGQGQSHSMRNSLASFRQLRCSMSYKNRHQTADSYREHPGTYSIVSRESLSLSHRNSDPTSMPSQISVALPPRTSARPSSSEVRMTEVNMAALQTRRAFQQMVLAMEDEDSEFEYESDCDLMHRRSSDSAGVIHIGVDEYRKFQFRLRQLEELCQLQAQKQAHMEEAIEAEVEARTSKVVEAMEKKIAMYKQAKELECEREIQRRMQEYDQGRARATGGRDSGGKLEKLLHPRRSRKQMEQRRVEEEQRQREMDQFREFIRSTEMRSTVSSSSISDFRAVSQALKGLNDPNIDESLLSATPNELIEMICVLRKHVSVQESHLDQAKKIISDAITAREEAEATAKEAVELTLALDSRLERASQEMVFIRDELRRPTSVSSSDLTARISQCSSLLGRNSASQMSAQASSNSSGSVSLPTSLPVSPASYSISTTPASSCPMSTS